MSDALTAWFFIVILWGPDEQAVRTPIQFGPFSTQQHCEEMRDRMNGRRLARSTESFPCWQVSP
jgi:hypothetical protein